MKSIDKSGIIGSLKDSVNSILGVRDDLGAALNTVCIIKRTWSGDELGEGTAVEESFDLLPSPRIVAMTESSKIVEGGTVQLGDLMLKMISKVNYPNKSNIDGSSDFQNIEWFYEIDGELYKVINVIEKHLYWNVQVRKLSNQKRYS